MKIEVLFPELCNLYGDLLNITYLEKCLPTAEIIKTTINEVPKFINEQIDFIYLGPMTEKTQEKVISVLLPYKEVIQNKINNNTFFLFTGNAFEILGNYIENEDKSKIYGLGILDIYSKRDMFHRYNSLFLGEFNDMKIVGFKNQFSHSFGDNSKNYFSKVVRGVGLNKNSYLEGFRVNNFIGTYLLGPLLILNPLFTKYLVESLDKNVKTIPFYEEAITAYHKRLAEFSDKTRKL